MNFEIGKKYKHISFDGIRTCVGFNTYGDPIIEKPDGSVYTLKNASVYRHYVEYKEKKYINVYFIYVSPHLWDKNWTVHDSYQEAVNATYPSIKQDYKRNYVIVGKEVDSELLNDIF